MFTRPIYRIAHLDACDTTKRDEWLEWRENLKTIPTSSTLCSYFGFGFSSLNKVIHDKIEGKEEKIDPVGCKRDYSNIFVERAMQYGTDNEKNAKRLFKKYLKYSKNNGNYLHVGNGEISYHSTICYDKDSVDVICTPDSMYLYNESDSSGKMIVEFKCPYKVVNERGNNSILVVAKEFIAKNPRGKENAFVQASTYSLWWQADLIYIGFYFTDSIDEECIVIYCYRTSQELFDIIFGALSETQANLKELSKTKNTAQVFRSPRGIKKTISEMMDECCIQSSLFYDDDHLE